MAEHLIDVDDVALERASELLDGAAVGDTVNTALRELCARDARERLFAHIQHLAAGDLGDLEVMSRAQRQWPQR